MADRRRIPRGGLTRRQPDPTAQIPAAIAATLEDVASRLVALRQHTLPGTTTYRRDPERVAWLNGLTARSISLLYELLAEARGQEVPATDGNGNGQDAAPPA